MKEIRILYLYPDMLNLYGDRGNIQALKYRAEKRNIEVKIDYCFPFNSVWITILPMHPNKSDKIYKKNRNILNTVNVK